MNQEIKELLEQDKPYTNTNDICKLLKYRDIMSDKEKRTLALKIKKNMKRRETIYIGSVDQ